MDFAAATDPEYLQQIAATVPYVQPSLDQFALVGSSKIGKESHTGHWPQDVLVSHNRCAWIRSRREVLFGHRLAASRQYRD